LWRRHSGSKWIKRYPDEWDYAKYLMKEELITNVMELARRIAVEFDRWEHVVNPDGSVKDAALGTLRNQITARINAEFEPADLDRLDAMRARLARSGGIARTHELIDKSNAKSDLGAVSMATKLMDDIAARASGTPSEVKEIRVRVDLDNLKQQLAERSTAPPVRVIDVEPSETLELKKHD
jgi:hypothetical protein